MRVHVFMEKEYIRKYTGTEGADKRLFSRMVELMSFKVANYEEGLVTHNANKRLLIRMWTLMNLQVALENDLPHTVQVNDIPSEWYLAWFFILLEIGNTLSHILHLCTTLVSGPGLTGGLALANYLSEKAHYSYFQ